MDGLGAGEEDAQAHEAERDLSLALFEVAAKALDLIVLVWQLDDDLVCFSSGWARRAHGVERLTYLDSMAVRALIHPNDHAELDAAIGRSLDKSHAIVDTSFRLRMPSGWLPVRARCRATAFDEGGRITRIVAMLTEENEAEAIRLMQKRGQNDAF
jgi:hypothetical protein